MTLDCPSLLLFCLFLVTKRQRKRVETGHLIGPMSAMSLVQMIKENKIGTRIERIKADKKVLL
jgi:hypothetical protein